MVKLTIRTSTSQPAAEKKTSPKNRMRWNGGLPPLLVSLLLLLHQPFAKPIQAFTSTTSNTATFSPATINPANKNGRQQQQRQQQHHRALFLQPSQFAATASEAPRSGGWSNSLTPHHYQKQVFSGATTFPPVKRRTLLDGHYSSRSSSSTARTMIVDPATAGGMLVLAGAISGGLFSGGLHAIAGTFLLLDQTSTQSMQLLVVDSVGKSSTQPRPLLTSLLCRLTFIIPCLLQFWHSCG